jgi:hypothetical protein
MLAPDSVANIVAVLDEDEHALPIWSVRALRMLLAERERLIAGELVATAADELTRMRRRLARAHALVAQWDRQRERYAHEYEGSEYELGVARGLREASLDLRRALTEDA